jgi:quinol-cytochrome oxidoreductase complex cytochrome b subunit
MKRNFLHHLHPPMVRLRTLHPLSTLGLGIACLTSLGVLFVTGFTLFLYYIPHPEIAYERILHIKTSLRYGGFLRDLHHVAANALVVLVILHLARVFLTGSYRGRFLNWVYGLALLALVLLEAFSGYLLPWDQLSYWAGKVGIELAGYFPLFGAAAQNLLWGGVELGEEMLLRTFALHAGVIPFLLLVFSALHLWRVRRDGGLAAPTGDSEHIPASPWLYWAEGGAALLTFAALIVLALIFPAPLAERADPLHPPNPAKAPWYFVGVQEMVGYSAFWGGVAAPVAIAAFLLLVPLFDRRGSAGVWFAPERRRLDLLFALVLLSQIAFIAIGQWLRGENWQLVRPFTF